MKIIAFVSYWFTIYYYLFIMLLLGSKAKSLINCTIFLYLDPNINFKIV